MVALIGRVLAVVVVAAVRQARAIPGPGTADDRQATGCITGHGPVIADGQAVERPATQPPVLEEHQLTAVQVHAVGDVDVLAAHAQAQRSGAVMRLGIELVEMLLGVAAGVLRAGVDIAGERRCRAVGVNVKPARNIEVKVLRGHVAAAQVQVLVDIRVVVLAGRAVPVGGARLAGQMLIDPRRRLHLGRRRREHEQVQTEREHPRVCQSRPAGGPAHSLECIYTHRSHRKPLPGMLAKRGRLRKPSAPRGRSPVSALSVEHPTSNIERPTSKWCDW